MNYCAWMRQPRRKRTPQGRHRANTVTTTRMMYALCAICHRPVHYPSGTAEDALTAHYRAEHPNVRG